MNKLQLKCAICEVRACQETPGEKKPPSFCPNILELSALDEAREAYNDPETRRLAQESARIVAEGKLQWTRVEEVMELARRLDVTRIGIAFCGTLRRETRVLQEIMELNGFEVYSVACKCGWIPKEDIGLKKEEKLHPEKWETMCNPVGQAKLLNVVDTGLNVVMGLCVGHDSLFFQHSNAPVTVLVAKDRITLHNSVAPLYGAYSSYRRLREKPRWNND